MNVGASSVAEITHRMAAGRLHVRTGPFTYSIQSRLAPLPETFFRLYQDFPLLDDAPFIDFHVHVDQCAGLRGWLLRDAEFRLGLHHKFDPFQRPMLLPYFEWGLNWCISSTAHHYLMLHTASLERDGRALLIAGPSGAGKSTLGAALALAGWRLLSDEFAILDDELRLHALARPISLKNEAIDLIRPRAPHLAWGPRSHGARKGIIAHLQPPAESVARVAQTARPGWILVLNYQPNRELQVEEVNKARAMMELAAQAFNYGIRGAAGFRQLSRLVDQSRCVKFTYSDLDEAVAYLSSPEFLQS